MQIRNRIYTVLHGGDDTSFLRHRCHMHVIYSLHFCNDCSKRHSWSCKWQGSVHIVLVVMW